MTISKKCLEVYQQSLKNLKGNAPDIVDEVVVSLWRVCEKQAAELEVANQRIREQCRSIDLLESQLAKAHGTLLSNIQSTSNH